MFTVTFSDFNRSNDKIQFDYKLLAKKFQQKILFKIIYSMWPISFVGRLKFSTLRKLQLSKTFYGIVTVKNSIIFVFNENNSFHLVSLFALSQLLPDSPTSQLTQIHKLSFLHSLENNQETKTNQN